MHSNTLTQQSIETSSFEPEFLEWHTVPIKWGKKKKKLQAQKNVYFPKISLKYLLDNEHYIVNATKVAYLGEQQDKKRKALMGIEIILKQGGFFEYKV